MVDSICIFEGMYYERLYPLIYFRPVYDLRCGILTLREKIKYYFPDMPIILHSRGYLADYVKDRNPRFKVNELDSKSCLFINGRVIADEDFVKNIPLKGKDTLYISGDTIVAARVSGKRLTELRSAMNDIITDADFTGLFKEEVDARVIHYPWDLVYFNSEEIIADYKKLANGGGISDEAQLYDGVHLLNKQNIHVGKGTKIYPCTIIDAESGPVFIGDDVTILGNTTIQGPAFVGDKSLVKMGSKLYHNSNIGRVCKVGGEIEDSVIHSYSNKQHEGFLGHSYLSSWVNLGAGTNNSDLKNNYGSIKVYINGEAIDSGNQFVGLTMGDHSKTAINTTFNTGTVVGVSCNVFGAGFPPRYIPSFSWGGADSLTTYDLERSIEVAQRVEERRKIQMSQTAERLFRKVFDLTREERRRRGMPN